MGADKTGSACNQYRFWHIKLISLKELEFNTMNMYGQVILIYFGKVDIYTLTALFSIIAIETQFG